LFIFNNDYDDDDRVNRLKELSSANEKLRAQLSERERHISTLQITVSSLESRLGTQIAREAIDRTGTPSVLGTAADHGQDTAGDALHRIACQLIADGEDLEVLGQTVDQVPQCFSTCSLKWNHLQQEFVLGFIFVTDCQPHPTVYCR